MFDSLLTIRRDAGFALDGGSMGKRPISHVGFDIHIVL